jgi:CO/xanthine dehydrogenase FAD-binding subunit
MYATNYHRAVLAPTTPSRLQSSSDEAKYVSGGMTLIPTMKQRLAAPPDLVDLACRRAEGHLGERQSGAHRRGHDAL